MGGQEAVKGWLCGCAGTPPVTRPGCGLLPGAGAAVEPGSGQPGAGDVRPVRPAATRVGGVEPLGEELAEPLAARAAPGRQPPGEARLQLRLADRRPAVPALDLLQRPGEVRVPEDLAQRDVGDAGPVVGGRATEQPTPRRVGRRPG